MPAPTAADGAARGIEEVVAPSALAIFAVIMAYHFYGNIIAGLILFGITILGFVVLASLARYWNAAYTVGLVAVGFFALLMIPSVFGELVHPVFNLLATIIPLVTLVGIASYLVSKLDLSRSSGW